MSVDVTETTVEADSVPSSGLNSLKLLPCPFCGGAPRFELDKKGHCQLHGDPFQTVKLRCYHSSCEAKPCVSGGDVYNGGLEKAQAEVAEKWNRRSPKNATGAA